MPTRWEPCPGKTKAIIGRLGKLAVTCWPSWPGAQARQTLNGTPDRSRRTLMIGGGGCGNVALDALAEPVCRETVRHGDGIANSLGTGATVAHHDDAGDTKK